MPPEHIGSHAAHRPPGISPWTRDNAHEFAQACPHGDSTARAVWSHVFLMNAIRASQHPEDCASARYLLIEDDVLRQGVGFTSRYWLSALRLAVSSNRVLMEVPVDRDWPGFPVNLGYPQNVANPRWCLVPPFTLQCFYQPWTHCPLPREILEEVEPPVLLLELELTLGELPLE